MHLTRASTILPLMLLASAGPIPRPTADACTSVAWPALSAYRTMIATALTAARADAQANGTTGAYAVAATNARDLLQRSYDRATAMVNFLPSRSSSPPTYAQAGTIKVYLQTILKWLPDAAHWATISAAYHRSSAAMKAFDGATAAMEQGSRLMGEAGRCYTAPYLSGAARAG